MESHEKKPLSHNEGSTHESHVEVATPEKTPPSFWNEIVKFSILAIIIVVPIRLFIAQPFIVSGASMEPTFDSGEYLIIDQLSYAFNAPQRGEVIIFRFPEDPSKFFIKRVIGLPNETVELRGREVLIKSSRGSESFVLEEPYLEEKNRESSKGITTLKSDEYFVMGDNRDESSDSRVWGPLREDLIVGRAFLRIFPITESAVLPGSFVEFE